ncbi:MAG: Na+/H+ antiporter subunit E [Deltaproteobacteria bacterium]|nr:Na+/H+ antiporter subunit E [Deltaproteobacteria bacterium]MBW2307468.1 Na+/H+ antiporter subunit E [Deltaproteobacteria bacterium]
MKNTGDRSSPTFQKSSFSAAFCILFALWLVLSGHYDLFHITLGVICSALVAYFSHDLLFPVFRWGRNTGVAFRFMRYLPWLFYQILLANVHVAKRALHPRMPIDPAVIQFKTRLSSDLALSTLANSITLTPGTITVDIREGKYFVHALTREVAEDLLSGEMENRVAAIYHEGEAPARKT